MRHAEDCPGVGCWVDCDCERGRYLSCQHNSCYECYLDRRGNYLTCIFCGKWHSMNFDCCFKCRPGAAGRDEAAAALRLLITQRDDFTCQSCGIVAGDPQWNAALQDTVGASLQVDHIVPCAKGGTADEWNLQLLCALCNRLKADAWWVGCRFEAVRTKLVRRYFLVERSYFTSESVVRFRTEIDAWRATHTWDPLAHKQWRELGIGGDDRPRTPKWLIGEEVAVVDL